MALQLIRRYGLTMLGGGGDPDPGGSTLGGPMFHSETNWSTTSGQAGQFGQRFTVGASDLQVGALMLHDASGATETVNLWRVSDQTLLASASVTSEGGWGETEIEPVTLASGQQYIVSRYAGGATRSLSNTARRVVNGNTLEEVYDPAVKFEGGNFVNGAGYPSSATGNAVGVNVRFVAPESGYRFYRLHFTAADGGASLRLDEVELRSTVGGADETGSGAAWEDSVAASSFTAANLFSGTSALWISASGVTDASVFYDFGTHNPQTIVQYTIKSGNTANQAPSAWTLEASNDLETWDVLHTVTGETGWSTGETRTYTI